MIKRERGIIISKYKGVWFSLKQNKTKDLVLSALFVALIAVGAFIKVPIPILPFTLQYLFTMLAGILLGAKRGAIAVALYVLIGLAGIPIFTQGGGIGYIFQPTFGYLVGFAIGAYVTGILVHNGKLVTYKSLLIANLVGLAVVYSIGGIYYYLICNLYLGTSIGLWTLFLYCFLLPLPGDIFLCIVGAILGKRLLPMVDRNR